MNGSISPGPLHSRAVDVLEQHAPVKEGANGPQSQTAGAGDEAGQDQDASGSRRRSVSVQQRRADNAVAFAHTARRDFHNGDDDMASEAETLIDSPVKKREAERQMMAVNVERPARSRIGGLPVPGEDDEESESAATPLQSTEASEVKVASSGVKGDTADEMDLVGDNDDSSGSLSSAPSPTSTAISLVSGHSRAVSEGPEPSRNGTGSPNPRKRKHRASSVGLPNKRQSMEPPRRTLRGMQSEDNAGTRPDRSPSPKMPNHRRAVSTQSAFMDGSSEGSTRKRRAATQYPVRDAKIAKPWEESDASSETTSHGHPEARRPQRGIGRSTSTPGRPLVREHKRHINKYGFTRLAEACESDDLELVKEWRDKDPDQLEIAEFAQNKPLQIAALNGNAAIVEYLIDQGCQIDCANVDKDTPLIDAAENGHLDVVQALLRAGVDPLRQNLKGQQALDVITEETDNADEIRAALRDAIESWTSDDAKQRREAEEEARHKAGPSKELHFMARTYENLLRLVTINDRGGVREFLDARVPVDNTIIAAAAKTGDSYLVNMLLAEMTEKKAHQKSEKPMLAVLGTSHFDMVKMLTELEQFNPLWRSRAGKTWVELAEERNGPNSQHEAAMLQGLYDRRVKISGRRSSSPVTKRESAKRKLPPRHEDEDDESEDEDGPKPKNGRRLMSRRAIRAASGKAALTDSDSEDGSTSDTGAAADPEPEASMRPPDTPTQRRGSIPTRQRTKSMSSHPPAPAESSFPRIRRRSSSLRGLQDQVLPTVEEKPEAMDGSEMEEHNRDQLARAQFALQQAQALEAKRREAEAAEAEAKRAEDAMKAEEKRKVEEACREAEVARVREAEEQARLAEEVRKADEERRRKEVEMEGARGDYRRNVLSALPGVTARLLNISHISNDRTKDELLDHCTPLLVVAEEDENDNIWLLNVQAAPLLGKRGLELLLPREHDLAFERTFCRDWTIRTDLTPAERARVQRVLHQLATQQSHAVEIDAETPENDAAAFQAEMKRTAERLQAIEETSSRLNSGTIALELVKLSDVFSHLDPSLSDFPIEVQYLSPSKRTSAVQADLDKRGVNSFLARMQAFWECAPLSRTYKGGVEIAAPSCVGVTQVIMVHEK